MRKFFLSYYKFKKSEIKSHSINDITKIYTTYDTMTQNKRHELYFWSNSNIPMYFFALNHIELWSKGTVDCRSTLSTLANISMSADSGVDEVVVKDELCNKTCILCCICSVCFRVNIVSFNTKNFNSRVSWLFWT